MEALAACGRIEPSTTLDNITARITELLGRPDDPDACREAAGMISNQFEDAEVVGPYYEAIEALMPLERTQLLVMAAAANRQSMWRSWTFEQLALTVSTGDPWLDAAAAAVIREAATMPESSGPMPHENASVHVAAPRAWARVADALPSTNPTLTDDETAWRLVSGLLMRLERPGITGDPERIWAALLDKHCAAAVDVLYRLQTATLTDGSQEVSLHDRLCAAFPDEARRLLEWGLVHREQLTSHFAMRDHQSRDSYIVRALGAVGSVATAALLRGYLLDPDLGLVVVSALR